MGKFTLSINLGNDAMQTSDQVANALRKVADRIQGNEYVELGSSIIRGIIDENGNSIGEWEIEPSDAISEQD